MKKINKTIKCNAITIPYIACLRYKYAPVEIHLKGDAYHYSPINIFQRMLYWMLGFEYIQGDKYVEYIIENKRVSSSIYDIVSNPLQINKTK